MINGYLFLIELINCTFKHATFQYSMRQTYIRIDSELALHDVVHRFPHFGLVVAVYRMLPIEHLCENLEFDTKGYVKAERQRKLTKPL